jgi:acylpyruvate hydrolase
MKFATYYDDGPKVGLVEGEEVWDLRRLASRYLFETERLPECRDVAERLVPNDMALFIRMNHDRLGLYRDMLGFAQQNRKSLEGVKELARPADGARLLAPVLTPSKLICCGSAYREYMLELGRTPEHPGWPSDVKLSFLKHPSALLGHKDTIHYPADSEEWDYENELAIIIGKSCSDIDEEEAMSCIFGFAVFNDSCVRDLPSWTGGLDSPRGKACDDLAPCGPWIVPVEDLGKDVNNLDWNTTVDGELRQKSNTSDLLWPVERMVAVAARYIRLSPGDIIATGSSKGNAHTNGKYLKVGQKVRCEIEGIGVLENTVGRKSWTGDLPPMPAPH